MFARVSEFLGQGESDEEENISDQKDSVSSPIRYSKSEIEKWEKPFIKEIERIVILKTEIFREPEKEKIKMSTNDKLKIPRFDGCDCSLWKKRILLFLKYKECYDPATRVRTNQENEEEWNKKNLKAMNFIYYINLLYKSTAV